MCYNLINVLQANLNFGILNYRINRNYSVNIAGDKGYVIIQVWLYYKHNECFSLIGLFLYNNVYRVCL